MEGSERDLDAVLQGLADPKTNPTPRFDLNWSAGVGIATDPSLAVLHFEGAEACEGHGSVSLEPLLDAIEDSVHETSRLELRGVKLLGDVEDEVALVHGTPEEPR
jgi:hypothetical protein